MMCVFCIHLCVIVAFICKYEIVWKREIKDNVEHTNVICTEVLVDMICATTLASEFN
jgi:hypothetical protein